MAGKRAGSADAPQGAGSGEDFSALGAALRMGTELVAGLAVGVAVGYGLDYWLGFRALFLILFSLLGGVAGMLNVWRSVSKAGSGLGN
nr:AtpZ/AtpI family protein [Neoasaia chiangmaiensis]